MIDYCVCTFSEVWDLMREMVSEQWAEVDARARDSKLGVMEDFYTSLEEKDLHYIVVALEDSVLLGYNSMIITYSPHTGTLHAVTDTIYVSPEGRGRGVGTELIKIAEEEAIERKAEHIMVTFKEDTPHDKIMKDLEFTLGEVVYHKSLRGEVE